MPQVGKPETQNTKKYFYRKKVNSYLWIIGFDAPHIFFYHNGTIDPNVMVLTNPDG
jgi:hypothetical protein